MGWRYRLLEDAELEDEKTDKVAFYRDGDHDNGIVWRDSLIQILNEWGAEGWELAAVIPGEQNIYIFKKSA